MLDNCKTLQDMMFNNSRTVDYGITYINSIDEEVFVSYRTLYEDALKYLGNLQKRGLKVNDVLLFQIYDNREFVTTFWACILGNIIPVPLTIGRSEENFERMLRVCNSMGRPHVIFDKSAYKLFLGFVNQQDNRKQSEIEVMILLQIEEFDPQIKVGTVNQCREDDIAFIQYSSGSTGIPKGVVLTHSNLVANTEGILLSLDIKKEDSSLSWMPLTHDMGLVGFHLTPFRMQINHYLIPAERYLHDPLLWMKKVSKHRVNVLASPNFGYSYYLRALERDPKQELDLSCVKSILNGAEPISIKVCNDFCERMKEFKLSNKAMLTVYGLAEATLAVAFPSLGEVIQAVEVDRECLGVGDHVCFKHGENSLSFAVEGYPILHCEITICDDSGSILSENIVGYIHIRGKNVTSGYYNDEVETQKVFNKDGWLNTGDLGFIHNGQLVVTGRAKDIIFVNGSNYYSHDLEAILSELNEIKGSTVAVCGYHNPLKQAEEILVFIEYSEDLVMFSDLAEKLQIHLWRKTGIKANHIIPLEKIPRTSSGKVQRFKLIDRYVQHELDDKIKEIGDYKVKQRKDNVSKVLSETEERLKNIYINVFQNNDIDIEDNLIDLGGDSLALTKIQQEIDLLYPGKVNIANIYANPTIHKMASFISESETELAASLNLSENNFIERRKKKCDFIYTLERDVTNQLVTYLETNNSSEEMFLLSVYGYLWLEITGEKEILIYTKLKGWKGFKSIRFVNNEYDCFEDYLIAVTKTVENNIETKIVTNLSRSIRIKGNSQIWISFLYDRDKDEYSEAMEFFDYSLLVRNDIRTVVRTGMNSRYLDKVLAEELLESYISIIQGIVKNKTEK